VCLLNGTRLLRGPVTDKHGGSDVKCCPFVTFKNNPFHPQYLTEQQKLTDQEINPGGRGGGTPYLRE